MLRKLFSLPSIVLTALVALLVIDVTMPVANAQSNRETILYASKTWSPGAIAKQTTANTTITVETAGVGDYCSASLGTSPLSTLLTCNVTAANTVTVYLSNNTATDPITPSSSLLRVRVISHPPYQR